MQPHDAIFKNFLSDINIARDFFSIHLPQHIKHHCDFSTLQLTSSSFVDEALRSTMSDMLYAMRTTQGHGFIYCLIEHQSRPDKRMALRLLRYSLAAMQQHLAQGNDELPLVVPLQINREETMKTIAQHFKEMDRKQKDQLVNRVVTKANEMRIALRLFVMGMPKQQIQQATGLSDDDMQVVSVASQHYTPSDL